ncbi:MAG: universal stress protein, partial [Desulfobacteraceae bacterium]
SGPLEKGVFQHVIYATDWSPVSESVLKYLLNLKEIIETLEIVNVIHKKLSVRELRSLRQRITETRRIFLDEGIDAEAHIYAGKPHEEILLAATDYDATAIVMGTSCKSPMQEIIRRSCSYRVAEDAEIPVLFIGQQQKME